MTRPMHQDAAAAAAVLRRTMVLLHLLLMFSLSSFSSVTAECPDKCECRGDVVTCIEKNLDQIPDSIPPATTSLALTFNTIRDIESLSHLTELECLELGHNNIRDIEPKSFTYLTELMYLFLEFNNISELKNGAFSTLSKLQLLELQHNNIRDIVPKSFTHLRKLETLILSNNNISELKNGAFANLSMLHTLYLNKNKIENIEIGVFNNLTSLKELRLDGNKIYKLDLGMFEGLTNLDELYLDHNMISNIPPGIFDSLTSLSHLQFDHNPLMCDCNILLFVHLLKKSDPYQDKHRKFPSCHLPVEISEKPLNEITENDFNCTSPDVIVAPENKTVSVGGQLKLSCKAVGDPEPSITWAKDDIDLELGQRVQVLQNNTLIISKVEKTDGGQYKCVASNYLGRKSFEAMVNVNGLAENGCNTMFGVIPDFFIIIIILANCFIV